MGVIRDPPRSPRPDGCGPSLGLGMLVTQAVVAVLDVAELQVEVAELALWAATEAVRLALVELEVAPVKPLATVVGLLVALTVAAQSSPGWPRGPGSTT